MIAVLIFLLVFVSSLFAGTLLAYPLFKLIQLFSQIGFPDVIILSTQLMGLIGSLCYLKFTAALDFKNLGFVIPAATQKRSSFITFTFGLMIVFLLGASLFVAGVYDLHSQRDFFPPVILKLAIGAIGTGVIVAVFEETVFRGALLQGLQKKVSIPVAIVMTSLVYTWIHFIHFAPPADLDAVGFFTAPMNFFSAYTDQMTIQNLDAVISIFVLGVLLAMIRVKQGNLFGCIALHAGLVAGIKIFRYLLEYQPDNSYQFLVSSHDYRLGFMATLWLFLATLVYCFLESRVRSEEDCAI